MGTDEHSNQRKNDRRDTDLAAPTTSGMRQPPESSDDSAAWRAVLERAATRQGADGLSGPFAQLFGPTLDGVATGRFVIAHLGQSLDGWIAMPDGESRYVTGADDLVHNHRLRALCDAVVVGASTVEADAPQLTVRRVAGVNPVRVIIDPTRRLAPSLGVFRDGAAPTLLVCTPQAAGGETRHGAAEIVAVTASDAGILPVRSVVDALEARRLTSLFVEGGGITVSRFIEAGVVDRLHVTIAPLLLGSGRPVLTLPAIARVDEARRLVAHPFGLGEDLLWDCVFDGRD